MMITVEQLDLLKEMGFVVDKQELEYVLASSDGNYANIRAMDEYDLVELAKITNALYRAGLPIVSDAVYDSVIIAELKSINAENDFLSHVEPEIVADDKLFPLPQKMLSTDKAYSVSEITAWLERVKKAAFDIGLSAKDIIIKMTPKLDGFAAYDDGVNLISRGDGVRGQLYTHAFDKGLVVHQGSRGLGAGEIVLFKDYFEKHLSEEFTNTRNVQSSVLSSKQTHPSVQAALDAGACVFFPFTQLTWWAGCTDSLISGFEQIRENLLKTCEFDTDGVVIEVSNSEIKEVMGSARNHHRWQIAFKQNGQSLETAVTHIEFQTGRLGNVTPVANFTPIVLSGVTVSRATLHNCGKVRDLGVGVGAKIKVVRSGEVTPWIEDVTHSVEPVLPLNCPSCGELLVWRSDFLVCENISGCPAQVERSLIHFFSTLGTVDGFGKVVVSRLVEAGITDIRKIYAMTQQDFISIGIHVKPALNLVNQLARSLTVNIEDWRFLSAFGINRLGNGTSEKLLTHYAIDEVFDLDLNQLKAIHSFGDITAESVFLGLTKFRHKIIDMLLLGFNLSSSKHEKSHVVSQIAGKNIVFTGTMLNLTRDEMKSGAKKLMANVQSSVNAKTDYLIAGERSGQTKIDSALKMGVTVLSESEYMLLIAH